MCERNKSYITYPYIAFELNLTHKPTEYSSTPGLKIHSNGDKWTKTPTTQKTYFLSCQIKSREGMIYSYFLIV